MILHRPLEICSLVCSVCVPNGGEREQKKEKGKKRRGKKKKKEREKKRKREQSIRKQETNRKKNLEEKRGKTVNNGGIFSKICSMN